MALDAYSPCPCGSGKKFKWCCQPLYAEIDKAYQQEAQGQHEAALRIMEELTAKFPTNPEAWGQKAQLLYNNNRPEEAEGALEKAFALNPRYAYGYLLRGVFRQNEGELPGALLLYRKAAESFDPEAKDLLGETYARIGDCELKLNKPVAARAAWQIAVHCLPGADNLRQSFDGVFGDQSNLPVCARRAYTFQGLPSTADEGRRRAWQEALERAGSGKLGDAAAAFGQITQDDPANAAAWYNLGLSKAWLGDNRAALEALDRYATLETDEGQAAAACALGEVLRCGVGMEEEANYLEHVAVYPFREPQPVLGLLDGWERQARLVGVQSIEEQGLLRGMVLERQPNLTPDLAANRLAEVGAYFLLVPGFLRVWNTSADALERVRAEVQQQAGPALGTPQVERRPVNFAEVTTEAVAIPNQRTDEPEARRRVEEHIQHFYEEVWIHRPLRSLGMIPPADAAGRPVSRKKLLGAVQFLQDCAAFGLTAGYDFDRLRRKLGLLGDGEAPAAPTAAGPDVNAMSAAELAGLAPESLDFAGLERAYQAAMKLDAREVAARFAKALVAAPSEAGRPDRFPWYSHLVQTSLAGGDTQAALDYLNEGEKADCEHNEGRRRNEYELRRAQIHARRGETGEAEQVFDRLIQRVPSELRYRGSAAEAMLSAKAPAAALRFAEGGLAKSREQNDRDSEGYFKELVAAASRP